MIQENASKFYIGQFCVSMAHSSVEFTCYASADDFAMYERNTYTSLIDEPLLYKCHAR